MSNDRQNWWKGKTDLFVHPPTHNRNYTVLSFLDTKERQTGNLAGRKPWAKFLTSPFYPIDKISRLFDIEEDNGAQSKVMAHSDFIWVRHRLVQVSWNTHPYSSWLGCGSHITQYQCGYFSTVYGTMRGLCSSASGYAVASFTVPSKYPHGTFKGILTCSTVVTAILCM